MVRRVRAEKSRSGAVQVRTFSLSAWRDSWVRLHRVRLRDFRGGEMRDWILMLFVISNMMLVWGIEFHLDGIEKNISHIRFEKCACVP
jgi:hypothetical protein